MTTPNHGRKLPRGAMRGGEADERTDHVGMSRGAQARRAPATRDHPRTRLGLLPGRRYRRSPLGGGGTDHGRVHTPTSRTPRAQRVGDAASRVIATHDRTALVDFICVNGDHVAIGQDVPDGRGTLTVFERRWAYCSAALRNTPHDWKETGGVLFDSIHHADLPTFPAAR